ncbi:LysM peptidoglycan-binding domain-containing protein [Hymenobacter cheonanensis]|uniref:LysM peptidoglycan-binding domain-containing protein n=1 Tax=Hymenobacter sp. CA2-7 TaxID=3063993 RepID=UPI002713F5E6|nr:LysM peptidoglycan-binding domain-containing protein [Hymenobacter sp. CA2-7]MDO7887467.1 LysM peptidoglycan-binding domain-containing protein [Hymenobacter sp. CA2-7]
MKALQQLPAPALSLRKPPLARRLLLLALTLGSVPAVAQRVPHRRHETAQPPQSTLIPGDTIRQVVELPAATLDSLAAEPLEEPAVDSARLVWLQTPATLYETVNDRMGCIETAAPHQFNTAVLAYVRLFTERQRGYTQRVLEREQFYFPTFEKYLAQYNLPQELKYLAVVESALIPTAKSPVGAVGLWQFMPPTAGDLRLKRDEWVDERMHPEKATEAACKHLRYLYGVFHDWELVLAAYNWGAGNMQRVMRKTGKRNFWELYPHLPAETRNYVPTFTAIMYAMKYAPQHSLNDPALRYERYEPLDTLGLRGQALDLRRLSRALGYTDSLTLGRYNPEVRHGGLPAGYRPYVLRYPSAAREHLGDVDRATLLAYCQPATELPQPLPSRQVWLAGTTPWLGHDALAATSGPRSASAEAAPRSRRVHYTVRRGQTVATVAEKFEVSPAQVRRWNDLPKHATLRPGRELVVFVPLPPAEAPAIIASTPLPAVPRHVAPADSAVQALAAANARYAREAQSIAQREAAQAKELLRAQKQQAARLVAQQQQAIFRAAALAKAAAAQEKAQRLAAEAAARPDTTPEADEAAASADTLAPPAPTRRSRSKGLATAAHETAAPEVLVAAKPAPAAPLAKSELYTVRPGDDLTHLARARGVSVAQVRAWNQLPGETVLAGQRLRFSAPAAADAVAATRPVRAVTSERPEPHFSTHTVQAGDTLYNISRRFKVSVQELRRLNHLTTDDVKLGQKLVVQAS